MAAGQTDKDKCLKFRVHVLKEIYDTEKAYLEKIEFVVQHVLCNARERNKLFRDNVLATVFCNIEDVLAHHKALFASMKECTGGKGVVRYESTLASCCLKHIEGFDVYHKYGSNHEQAQRVLREILQDPKVLAFFSGCMLLGDMGDESRMDAFLVMPIQRICKYPLLMKELLKYTPADHPDYQGVQSCLQKMKNICNATNEAKRRWEKLEEIAEWQNSIEGWEGPHITESCNEMILKGQLTKISAGNTQERQIFLLDNSLVYCKKIASHTVRDVSKRRRSSSTSDSIKPDAPVVTNLLFRGRIALDNLDIENIEDGTKDYHSHGVPVHDGWKVHNLTKNKWFVLIAKHGKEKQEWMDAIRREKAKRKSRAMGIAHNNQQLMVMKGDKIYHSMKKDAKSVIKDHKVKFRTHAKCFTGSELVTWLVMTKEAIDEEKAVILGQGLLECGVIHHVLDKHNFQNDNLLYRFRYDDGTYRVKQATNYLVTGGLRIYLRLSGQHNTLLKDLKTTFGSSSKNVLSGVKLIDWMVQNEMGHNREQAVAYVQDLFGIKILRHITDEQGFKDIAGVYYRFTPDDGQDGGSSKAKVDITFRNSFACANIEVPYTADGYGFELSLKAQTIKRLGLTEQKLKVTVVEDKGDAQAKGLCEGQVVVGINSKILNTSEKRHAQSIVKECVKKSSPIGLLIERGSSYRCELVMLENEGLGFHIKGSAPVIIYATDPGSSAARAGVVPGSCIVEVNNIKVLHMTHDEVVKEIRKVLSNGGCELPLRLAQPGLEHVMEYQFETSDARQVLCFEHIFESFCTFSVPAQLLFLFGFNMTKFAEEITPYAKEDARISKFVDDLTKVIATTNKHATTLQLHGKSRWPSYKPSGVQSNKLLDGCPTNCHTHVLTVTSMDDASDLLDSGEANENGTMENGWESELQDCTRHVFTTMAAPDLMLGSQKFSEEEQANIQDVKEKIALLKEIIVELQCDEDNIERLVHEMNLFSSKQQQLTASMDSPRLLTLPRSRLEPTPENSPLNTRRRLSQSESFTLLTPDASPMLGRRRATSFGNPQPLLRLLVQGMVKKLPSILAVLRLSTLKHAYKETAKFSKDYNGYHQILVGFDEDTMRISHDLEDTSTNPSTSTIECAKSLVRCVTKYITECRKHLMLYVALKDDVALFQREQLHFSQCLSAVLSTLSCHLTAALSGQYNPERQFNSDNTEASSKWLEQLAAIGLLVKFEGLLLPDKENELLQLKLLRSTVSLLRNVVLHFDIQSSENTKALTSEVSCEGDQYGLHVTFKLPAHFKDRCPDQLLSSQGIKINPVLFTKDLIHCSSTTDGLIIADINNESINLVKQYYKFYRAFKFDKNSLPSDRVAIQEAIHQLSQPLNDLDNLITQLCKEISDDQRSSVGLLSLTTELCQRLGAVQISMCDSGVHRSMMSLSLEEVCILTRCHGLPIRSLRSAVRSLRSNGAYQILMQKNQTDPNKSFPKEPVKLYQPLF